MFWTSSGALAVRSSALVARAVAVLTKSVLVQVGNALALSSTVTCFPLASVGTFTRKGFVATTTGEAFGSSDAAVTATLLKKEGSCTSSTTAPDAGPSVLRITIV